MIKTISHGLCFLICLLLASMLQAKPPELLFYVSAEKNLSAEVAKGEADPNFSDKIERVATGPRDSEGHQSQAIEWADDGVLAWSAPGNLQAARGTLSFYWRARYAVDDAPFVIFRAGFSDHSSWDMAWLRIDWNGAGFDAFVTDANLARTRVSTSLMQPLDPARWYHLALSWDETQGIAFYIDGEPVARARGPLSGSDKNASVFLDFDTGLDSFGLAGRVLSPHQVQSRYNFLRGSDIAHLAIFDAMLTDASVVRLSQHLSPQALTLKAEPPDERAAWLARFNWAKHLPPQLPDTQSSIRKIEFTDARDIKQWMFKGVDGISETTWPGVYNRSRLPGRNDYFQLPDWNTYVEGGIHYDLTLPDEPVNLIEIRGAAFGELQHQAASADSFKTLGKRKAQTYRSSHRVNLNGGVLRFANSAQETPIQEIWAYNLSNKPAPQGVHRLNYSIDSAVKADYTNLDSLNQFIAGRFPANAQQTVMALPAGASLRRAVNPKFAATDLPLVHVLIPASVSHHPAEKSVTRSWAYGFENSYEGLDGIELSLPALNLPATRDGLIALNLQIKDPLWPERNMLDVSFSIKPNKPYRLWLDLRDRILSDASLYLTLAASAAEFNASHLDGAEISLVFKPREAAKVEHLTDRFNQVKDNWGNLVEEHTSSQRMALYRRAHADISDLLRVDPEHKLGRLYWYYMSFKSQRAPDMPAVVAPEGVPFWAHAQLEELKLVRHFVNWWIDQRQAPFGDFGGGISDDTDMLQQWPGLALMGVDREKITESLIALSHAVDKDATMLNGLSAIETDELHVYEEGINSNSALFTLLMGDPVAAARLLETVAALPSVIKPNPQGHTLFSSNWYGGKKIYHGPNWEWQKPYSFYVAHPALLLGEYAGHKPSRDLVTRLAAGYLAYAYSDEAGRFTLPNEINWRTGAVRGGEMNRGAGAADLATFFSVAHEWTGDRDFLKGIDYRTERGGAAQLQRLNDNFIDRLDTSGTWRRELTKAAKPGASFENFVAWETTGDKRYLDDLYKQEIYYKQLHQYFHTEGHWWTDRVDTRADLLQRARLGGVALVRNKMVPGHTLGWDFNHEDALKVAILMPRPLRNKFKIIGFNTEASDITAVAQGYLVETGRWRMRVGIDKNGDDKIDELLDSRELDFARYTDLTVKFIAGASTIVEMELIEAAVVPSAQPDLALSPFDLVINKDSLTVGVHNIGSAAAGEFIVALMDTDGNILASETVKELDHPHDSRIKRVPITLPLKTAVDPKLLRIEIICDASDLNPRNNVLPIKAARTPLAFAH